MLLLNTCLTVREKEPKSHSGKASHRMYGLKIIPFNPQGWEKLTDAVIHWINDHISNVVFLLWGTDAQKKASFINEVCAIIEWLYHVTGLSYHCRQGTLFSRQFTLLHCQLIEVSLDASTSPKQTSISFITEESPLTGHTYPRP